MALTLQLKRWFDLALDLLYPPKCAGCGDVGQGVWCLQCAAQVKVLAPPDHIIQLDLPEQPGLSVLSAAAFATPLREGIHEFKYSGAPMLAAPLAHHMLAAWQAKQVDWTIDLLAPVPLHSRRRRERGYNQSELLAAELALAMRIPMQPAALQRNRYTEQQAHLDAAARQHNVVDAFVAHNTLTSGKRILLIDDVFTTGATLRACALSLLKSGAANVYAMTLARA